MVAYSILPRNWLFVKGYGFLSFVRNMGENIGKTLSRILGSKYSQKPFNDVKQFATDGLKTALKRAIQLVI